ncbi:MAG: diguanylate cyclase, partial [Sulfuricurvum sp.]|nr:diguanylate cyclase [Sulfuricurvum sp.]
MHDAYTLMEEKHYRHLIVIDENQCFVGVITEGDFLRHIGLEHLTKFKTVAEAMSESPLIVELKTSLIEAAALMNDRKCDYAIVLNGAIPIGVITERDIARRCACDENVSDELVENLFHSDIVIIGKEIALHHAASMMEEHGVHQLIVVDTQGNLSGILTRHDVLHAVHGAYFEYLIRVIDEKSAAIARISERKRSLKSEIEEVEKNATKLRKLFEALPDGVVLIDNATLQAVEFNQTAYEYLGYTAEEFAQLKISDYDTIESPKETSRRVEAIMKNGRDSFETIHRAKDGTLFNMLINVVALELAGHPHMIAVYRDISNRKKAEQALEYQSNFLRTLFDNIPDPIWIKNYDGKYLACNVMFERLAGATEKEILGKSDFEIVSRELAQFFRDHDLKAMNSQNGLVYEEFLTFLDGSYAGFFETTKTAMKNEHGAIIGVLGIARDITERVKRETEMTQIQVMAHIGTWEWDAKKDLFTGSEEAYRVFGASKEALITLKDVLERFLPEERERVIRQFSFEEHKEANAGSVYRIYGENGSLRWIKTHTEFHFDENQNIVKAIGLFQDITEQIEYEAQLETLANYDPLTGLANRSLLLSHLQSSIMQAKRDKTQIALLMFDLDRFKDINDSFGHSAGDELLQQVAERFSSRLREGDIISRLGGDEFAVIVDRLVRPEDGGRLAEEMIATLESGYKLSGGASIHIGASAGIVLFPEHGESAAELLQHADAALYKAKSEGRGIYRYYTDELTESARRRIECETRLRYGIKNEEFEVYYQPQVHIQTGRIVGAEALIRWNDPIRGIVSPVEFIPIAEETGLIGEIGEWVLNETCRQGK